jgi:hypothetical protein
MELALLGFGRKKGMVGWGGTGSSLVESALIPTKV